MSRRIVRKLDIRRYRPLEERLWPTLVALALLAGMSMGTVAAYLRADDARWFANAWTWMVAIPLAALLTAFWMVVVDRGQRRRPVQLALVLGMIVHLVLLIACLESHLVTDWMDRVRSPAAKVVARPEKATAVPRRFRPQVQPVPAPKDWERPVATEPRIEVPPQKVVRKTESRPETSIQPQPRPVPEPRPTIRPEKVARREPRPSPTTPAAPSEARRSTEAAPRASSRPQVLARSASRSASQIKIAEASTAGRRSAAAQTEPTRSRHASSAAARVSSSAAAAARDSQTPEIEIRPRNTRRFPERSLASAPVSAPKRRSRQPRADQALEPQAVAVRSRTSASTDVSSRPTVALEPQPRRLSPVPTRREVELPRSVARASGRHTPKRRDTRRPVASTTQLAEAARSRAPREVETPLEPSATARRVETAEAGSPANSIRPASRSEQQPSASLPRGTTVARAESSFDDTQVSAHAASSPHRSRSVELAGTPVEQRLSANAGGTSGEAEAALEAAAVDRGVMGTAGAGASPNLSPASEPTQGLAQLASGSMPRRADMQSDPSDAALSPSQRSPVPRRRTEAKLGGTSVDNAPVALAGSASNARLPELSPGSSAGQRQAAADADSGPASAMRGTSAADLGVTRVVGRQRQGRAAGGGQPEVSSMIAAQSRPRRGRGSGRLAPRSSSPITGASSGTDAAGGSQRGRAGGMLEPASDVAVRGAGRGATGSETADLGPSSAESGEDVAGAVVSSEAVGPLQLARSEAAGADSREPAPGLGTGRSARRLRGPQMQLSTKADTTGVAAGADAGEGREAAAVALEAGASGRVSGAEATGPVSSGAQSGGPEVAASAIAGSGTVARAGGNGLAATVGPPAGSSGRRARRGLGVGALSAARVDTPTGSGAADRGSGSGLAWLDVAGVGSGRFRRPDGGADRGTQAAAASVGGEGTVPSAQMAIHRSEVADPRVPGSGGRFRSRRPGGIPDINTSVVIGRRPFRQRMARLDREGPEPRGRAGELTIPTEKAIELGLLFLKRCQSSDGSWKLQRFAEADGDVQLQSDTAATGLALLAFQGAGYHHRSAKYGETVGAALRFLIDHQRPNGDLYIPMGQSSDQFCRLYSHGIAAIAMCEAYGMTQDPALLEPAQKAIDFIALSQDKRAGGWRYQPGRSSDTSVTGWMVMALKSGQLAGLRIPDETMAGVERWLGVAQVDDRTSHLFRYNPHASDAQRHGRLPSPTMTSVGLLMRMYAGWDRTDVRFRRGADYLLQSPPALGGGDLVRRDTYYWYYATQVMYHVGGRWWDEWYRRLYPLLLESQIQQGELAGSWDPLRPVPDRWAPHAGRIYVTTMNLLSLEVRYRILPLYEETIGGDSE